MATSKALQKQTILDDLVNQFSDPLSFFRELIQNAIDAGSGQVDVYFDFQPDDGTMIIHVDDFGEGMTRQIIEGRLTRLFSSAKDDDYTKIGKFGIGFVSVFAIEPDAVCVDTGRTGQSWRVLFDADKTYELFALDRPVEGTQIRIIKQTTRAEFDQYVDDAREVILRWCKHVPVPIYFEDEEIELPFDIDSACKVTHREEGTRLVMGLVDEMAAPFGYYNRGLTLKEGRESPWPHVAFKIDSRYLEHTLTRDQILEDKNFHKAWKLLEKTATRTLPEHLIDQLEQIAAQPGQRQRYERLCALLANWLTTGGDLRRRWDRRPLIPTVGGEPVSPRTCRRRAEKYKLLFAGGASRLTEKLADEHLIVRAAPNGACADLVSRLTGKPARYAKREFVFAADATVDPAPGAAALAEEVRRQVHDLGAGLDYVGFRRFDRSEACSDWMAVPMADRFEPRPVRGIGTCDEPALRDANHLVINLSDERVQKLVDIARTEPEWAGFTLVKFLLLGPEMRADLDSLLATRAIERRKRRLT